MTFLAFNYFVIFCCVDEWWYWNVSKMLCVLRQSYIEMVETKSWDAFVNIWVRAGSYIKKFVNYGGKDYSARIFQQDDVNEFVAIYLWHFDYLFLCGFLVALTTDVIIIWSRFHPSCPNKIMFIYIVVFPISCPFTLHPWESIFYFLNFLFHLSKNLPCQLCLVHLCSVHFSSPEVYFSPTVLLFVQLFIPLEILLPSILEFPKRFVIFSII